MCYNRHHLKDRLLRMWTLLNCVLLTCSLINVVHELYNLLHLMTWASGRFVVTEHLQMTVNLWLTLAHLHLCLLMCTFSKVRTVKSKRWCSGWGGKWWKIIIPSHVQAEQEFLVLLLCWWDLTIRTLVSSDCQWDVVRVVFRGSGLHCPPQHPGFAGLTRSTAAMSLTNYLRKKRELLQDSVI